MARSIDGTLDVVELADPVERRACDFGFCRSPDIME
jgi:hypothetical protein